MVHLLILLILSRLWHERYQTRPVHDEIAIDISYLPRIEDRPSKPQKPPPPAKPTEEAKKFDPPKPTPTSDAEWQVEPSFDNPAHRETTSKIGERSTKSNQIRLNPHSRLPNSAYPIPQPIAAAVVPLQPTRSDDVTAPTENENISLSESGRGLKANSLEVSPADMRYWHTRGAVLRGAPVGNSYGSYGSGGASRPQGNYIKLMTDLALDIAEAATTPEVDIVFIVDKTGSMKDNVRGIRAYTDEFLDHLARTGHNAAVGLVTFSDAAEEKPNARGVTAERSKFKTWLHEIEFEGGGDLLESGLDALMTAVDRIKFRTGRQRFFVFASDAAFHDADYDGKSEYSLDFVIETLQRERIRVNVLGLDYLPVKQIAWGTQGVWRAIPGKGYLEYVPPITMTAKMLSEFGVLGFNENSLADELVVYIKLNPRPKWIKVSWKILNPLGERCSGPYSHQETVSGDDAEVITLSPTINVSHINATAGTHTVIYHLENDLGHQSILRRTFEMP